MKTRCAARWPSSNGTTAAWARWSTTPGSDNRERSRKCRSTPCAGSSTPTCGLLRLTQLVLPGMRRARQGRIVNIGSMGGRLTFPGGGAYHATKHALVALNDALRFEVRGFGIDVVLIEPGLIRTGFGDVALASLDRLER